MDPKKPPTPERSGLADTDPAVADTYASDAGPLITPDDSPAREPTSRGPRQVRTGDSLDGRYDLLEEIGEGGMATVFRARDQQLRREVAVKVLFPHLARRTEVVRRFHREARAAANLEHANILRIYDVGGGEGDEPPFIVMELIRGRTLLEELEQRGAIFAEITACIGALLADALSAAHGKGIIHRDIKPSNVLIAQGGRLLLADFGVARLETEDSLVTRTGALLGTPAYMSPEQASGDTATVKSDVYSLGATLYQLATAMLPYSGSPAKVMSMIATGSLLAPVKRRAEVGPDLSAAITRMMAVDPQERPASAAAVASELRELAATSGFGDATEELAAYFEDPAGFLERKRPGVVQAIVVAGKQAIAQSRLPRALALADRASALAPEDPAVKTLVETVTEGDRATRRRKLVALGAVGVLVLGGGAVGIAQLASHAPAVTPDATGLVLADAAPVEVPADTAPDGNVVDAGEVDHDDAPVLIPATRDAAPVRRDAAVTVSRVVDAAPPDVALELPDAAVTIPPDAPVVVENGKVIVSNDTWCDVTVDGVPRGRLLVGKTLAVELPPGPHEVICAQESLGKRWVQRVVVVGGKAVPVAGSLLGQVDVVVAISTGDRIEIDRQPYPRGSVLKLKPGRYQGKVMAGDKVVASGFFDVLRVNCRVHEVGQGLACDP